MGSETIKKAIKRVCPAPLIDLMRRAAGTYHPVIPLDPHGATSPEELRAKHLSGAENPAELVRRRAREVCGGAARCELTEKDRHALDKIMRREFDILGENARFDDGIDWSSDFRGGSWKKGDYEELESRLFVNDFTAPDCIGDIKIPWELSKHLHFLLLARAYAATGDEKYAAEFAAQADDWMEQNPVPRNVPWTHPLIAAQRAIAWIEAFPYFAQSPSIGDDFWARFLASLYDHARFIEANYERPRKTTNHLVGNLVGVLAVAVTFPEFDRSPGWKKQASGELFGEIKKQVISDGADYEGSVSYHRYVLEYFLYTIVLARRYGFSLPRSFKRRAEKMTEFLMHALRPDRLANQIGDSDGARVYVWDDSGVNDCAGHLALGACLFGRGDFKFVSGIERPSELLCFFGEDALREYEAISQHPPRRASAAFRRSGYFFMRDSWGGDAIQMHFDCANIGRGYNDDENRGAHGQDDLLSFGLNAFGEPLLHDLGSGTYTGDRAVHDYMRSSLGHNTFLFGDSHGSPPESHSILRGYWCLEKRARPLGRYWNATEKYDFATCAHDGYRRFTSPLVHRRSILFVRERGLFVVFDAFTGRAGHAFTCPFHFAPALEVSGEISGGDGVVLKGNSGRAAIDIHGIFRDAADLEIRQFRGSRDPFRGWYSPDYGCWEPATVAEIHGSLALPTAAIFVLRPEKGRCGDIALKRREADTGVFGVDIIMEGEKFTAWMEGFGSGANMKNGGIKTMSLSLSGGSGGALNLLWEFRRGAVIDYSSGGAGG